MDTVRIARDLGTVSELLPPGIRSLRDCPVHLWRAIKAGLYFLSFDEIIEPEDRPPREIWTDGKKLETWFEEVRRRQKRSMEGRGEIEDPVRNAAVDMLVVGD